MKLTDIIFKVLETVHLLKRDVKMDVKELFVNLLN